MSVYSELLECVEDPHEFATAYVNYVESMGVKPDVVEAVQTWVKRGQIA